MTERLRLPAALVLCLGSFPVWHWLCRWQLRRGEDAFALLGVTAVLFVLAWLHKRLDRGLCERSLLLAGILVRVIAAGIGIGAYFVCDLFLMRTGAVTAGALLGLGYLLGYQLERLPVRSMLSVYAFILIGTSYFISQVICFLQSRESLGTVCLWMLGGTAVLFVILRNLWMLLDTRTGRDAPQGYYRHNLLLVLIFLLPGAAVLLVGRQIADGAEAFLKMLWHGLILLVRWLSVLLLGEQLFADDSLEMGQFTPDMLPVMRAAAVVTLLMAGAGLFLLIRFREELWDFIRQVMTDTLRMLRRLARAKSPAYTEEIREEYTDRSELLDVASVRQRRPMQVLSWNRRLRQFRRERDPRRKFRMGYALWMTALQKWQTELTAQDTPEIILRRSSGIPDPELTGEITQLYYRVRYGEEIPDETALRRMKQLVDELK